MKAELVPENGDLPIRIVRDLTVVGRHPDCDVVIDNPSLSKRHCVLVKTDGLLVIRDLVTTNGTKVKGQKIRWAALLPDDKISFGGYKVRIYLGSDEMPAPSELRSYRDANGGNGAGSRGVTRKMHAPTTPVVGDPSSGRPQPIAATFPAPSFHGLETPSARPESDLHPVDISGVRTADEPDEEFEILDDDDDIIELS